MKLYAATLLLGLSLFCTSAHLNAHPAQFGEEMSGTAHGVPPANIPEPLALTIMFLELEEFQVALLVSLMEERDLAVKAVLEEIMRLEEELARLLEVPDATPPEVGTLVLEIRNRRIVVQGAQKDFQAAFNEALVPEQRDRLDGARLAKELQPVLPALTAVGLI